MALWGGVSRHKNFNPFDRASLPSRPGAACGAWSTSLSLLAVVWSLVLGPFEPAHAQGRCECRFADSKWQAFGTNAACTAFMGRSRTSCEVAFGGLGADVNVARSVLGSAYPEYQTQIIGVLRQYLDLLERNNRDGLADPKFIRTALPIFMRGAYFRVPRDDADAAEARILDAAVTGFFDKYSDDVSRVFLGKKEAFSTSVNDTKFEIGKGYIVLDDSLGGRLITSYMPAE